MPCVGCCQQGHPVPQLLGPNQSQKASHSLPHGMRPSIALPCPASTPIQATALGLGSEPSRRLCPPLRWPLSSHPGGGYRDLFDTNWAFSSEHLQRFPTWLFLPLQLQCGGRPGPPFWRLLEGSNLSPPQGAWLCCLPRRSLCSLCPLVRLPFRFPLMWHVPADARPDPHTGPILFSDSVLSFAPVTCSSWEQTCHLGGYCLGRSSC